MKITVTEDQCKKFVNDVFMNVLGKDFEYVVRAVYEKMEREGELGDEEADNTEFQQA